MILKKNVFIMIMVLIGILTLVMSPGNLFGKTNSGGENEEIMVSEFEIMVVDKEEFPVDNAIVNFNGVEETTNVNGVIVFNNVEEGTYNLEVEGGEDGYYNKDIKVDKEQQKYIVKLNSFLEPGEHITGIDGVTVGAPEGALEKGIPISVEKVDDPGTEVPYPDYLDDDRLEIVSEFYSVTSDKPTFAPDDSAFILGLPVPEDVPPEQLGVVGLFPPAPTIPEPVMRWDVMEGTYDEENDLLLTVFYVVDSVPQKFAIISIAGDINEN